ncbi:hypothetical protein L596_021169 [Steinernema carpocapsae]|uniref:7TM GPCR serpentine receptor class x (Srx) domain-containing protein n=1 Tax=Steinernema carpocapsae TaxID=34508 RepID=A0A4U5MVY0_STECR|nr:hypothetical protein L596_021169 [Steinernema carpocapsae]
MRGSNSRTHTNFVNAIYVPKTPVTVATSAFAAPILVPLRLQSAVAAMDQTVECSVIDGRTNMSKLVSSLSNNFVFLVMVATVNYICGVAYFLLPCVFLPCYLRILYIFVSKTSYRSLQCYQIMIQIGIVQCVIATSYAIGGICSIMDADVAEIGSYAMRVLAGCLRAETGFSFILAFDRLRVVMKSNISDNVPKVKYFLWGKKAKLLFKVFMVMVWAYGITHSTLLFTPLARLNYMYDALSDKYDYSMPHSFLVQEIGAVYSWVLSCVTFLMYVAIAMSVMWQQRSNIGSSSSQSWIIVQAGIRFACDLTIALTFHLGPIILPPMMWLNIFVGLGYIFNNTILPPTLFIVLNKTLRKEVLYKTGAVQVHTSVTRNNMERLARNW